MIAAFGFIMIPLSCSVTYSGRSLARPLERCRESESLVYVVTSGVYWSGISVVSDLAEWVGGCARVALLSLLQSVDALVVAYGIYRDKCKHHKSKAS